MSVLEKYGLDGRKAYVTGGSRGIGKSFAIGFAEAGADVAIVACGLPAAEETAHAIEKLGVKAMAVKADVTVPEQGDGMMSAIAGGFGTVDVGLNNAGIAIVENAEDATYESLKKVIDVNLIGLSLCCKSAARVMMKHGRGSIINMASMSAHVVNVLQKMANYNASKAAVVQLTKCLAVEWAPYHI